MTNFCFCSCKTAWNEEIFGKVDAKGKHQCKTDGCHGQLEARSGIEVSSGDDRVHVLYC